MDIRSLDPQPSPAHEASIHHDLMQSIGAAIRSWESGRLTEEEARAQIRLLLRTRRGPP